MEDVRTKLEWPAAFDNARALGRRAIASPRAGAVALATIVVFEFIVLVPLARARLLWYDELLTLHISHLQPFAQVWRALQAGADGMPVGYYILVRLANLLPGDPEIVLRLPSIVGYLLSLVGVYWFARKRLSVVLALTAVLLITVSPFRNYALEARPYSLLVGFLAIAAVFWQRIGDRRLMVPLFAVFLALAVACHHLAVLTIGCFGAAELALTVQSRHMRWTVWIACLLATVPFFVSLPLLLHYKATFGQNFWAQAGWRTAASTYEDYLGVQFRIFVVIITLLFGFVLGNALLRSMRLCREQMRADEFTLPEILLISGFLLYPAVLVVLTKIFGSGYVFRYGWPVILGLVLASAYLIQTIGRKSLSFYLFAALAIAFMMRDSNEVRKLYIESPTPPNPGWNLLTKFSRNEPNLPVVMSRSYLDALNYAPPDVSNRLIRVANSELATYYLGTDTADKTDEVLSKFIPLHLEGLKSFKSRYRRFLLYSDGKADWMADYLTSQKYCLVLLVKVGDRHTVSIYHVEPTCSDYQ